MENFFDRAKTPLRIAAVAICSVLRTFLRVRGGNGAVNKMRKSKRLIKHET